MNFCIECFNDKQIRTIIEQGSQYGKCDFCNSEDVQLCSVDENENKKEIEDLIGQILDIYNSSYNMDEGIPISDTLSRDWSIFNCPPDVIQLLLENICKLKFTENKEMLTSPVSIRESFDDDYLKEFGVVSGFTWKEFSESIKQKNRFHSGLFNPEALASYLSYATKTYPVGTEMYRARICPTKSGYPITEMSAPPFDKRTAGRINPDGIGILYLASDQRTSLNEVRAAVFDFVAIGEFQAKKELNVVELSEINKISPFKFSDDLITQFAVNKDIFRDIATDIAKPMRRNDTALEYLPTQYIAEFIKSQGYDGVEYASTMGTGGYNLAIFDDSLFECRSIEVVEVKGMNYSIESI